LQGPAQMEVIQSGVFLRMALILCIAEEAAKAVETDTVDTEQSVEDEIAAFEAELEAELGQ